MQEAPHDRGDHRGRSPQLSATIEVVDRHGGLLGGGRFATDKSGYTAMRSYVKNWLDRVWAVEGANGAGRPLAQRLVEAGEQVLNVPAKLAARARGLDTGHNRKTDSMDAHSIAMVAVRTSGLRVVARDGELEALRMLTDRRDELARSRVQTVNRLQRLLSELIPGQLDPPSRDGWRQQMRLLEHRGQIVIPATNSVFENFNFMEHVASLLAGLREH